MCTFPGKTPCVLKKPDLRADGYAGPAAAGFQDCCGSVTFFVPGSLPETRFVRKVPFSVYRLIPQLRSPKESFIVSLASHHYRPRTAYDLGSRLPESVGPSVMLFDRLLPDPDIAVFGLRKPGAEDHFRQQQKVGAPPPAVPGKALPGSLQAVCTVRQLADCDAY